MSEASTNRASTWPPPGEAPRKVDPSWPTGYPPVVIASMPWALIYALGSTPWLLLLILGLRVTDASALVAGGVLVATVYSAGVYLLLRGPVLVAGPDWVSSRPALRRWRTARFQDVERFSFQRVSVDDKKSDLARLDVTLVRADGDQAVFTFPPPVLDAGLAMVEALRARRVTEDGPGTTA